MAVGAALLSEPLPDVLDFGFKAERVGFSVTVAHQNQMSAPRFVCPDGGYYISQETSHESVFAWSLTAFTWTLCCGL